MSVGPLVTEIGITFLVVAYLLHKYGNWGRHHILVTVNVFIAWYFAFIIIFILPVDVSSTAYNQCLQDNAPFPTSDLVPYISYGTGAENDTDPNNTVSDYPFKQDDAVSHCLKPWSYVPQYVLTSLWRVVYWTAQALTWIILPMMQSYSNAGDFTVAGKLKTAVVENAIYYGTYLLIFGVLLIYVAAQPDIHLDGSKLKVICITASNTWGLFLLVLLQGYGLVEIPRSCWNTTKRGYMLNYLYFKASKLSTERCEAEEKVDDVLEELQQVSECISGSHPLRQHIDLILEKCPEEKKDVVRHRRHNDESQLSGDAISERNLARLHKQIIRAIHMYHRTQCQWNMLLEQVFHWEDVARNEGARDRVFKSTFMPERSAIARSLYTPKLEWYWNCMIRNWVYRTLCVILAVLTCFVVWSEMTFFTQSPTLSLFAIFIRLARTNYNYISIEVISTATIAYLCVCAYYTVFRLRVLNYYYLAPHHQTNEHSLIFCGMLLCRLTPPLCLNFLGLIHLDSHVTKVSGIEETSYTKIMGHMDVISIISDGFNIYFPILIFFVCLATYFNIGSLVLHLIGFEQFIGDDDMTADLVEEGRELIKREKNRRQRQEDGENRRRQFQKRFGGTAASGNCRKTTMKDTSLIRTPSDENARAELLRDVEPIDYTEERGNRLIFGDSEVGLASLPTDDDFFVSEGNSYHRPSWNRIGRPPGGFFDDV